MATENERLAQLAADFLARSREETPAERQAREAWLAKDPRHLRIYRSLEQLDKDATALLDDPELRALLKRDSE
ncbi:DUF4880 domain-containing protein [Luteimonas fraxinea]|uniref:DUF4880 domain-containing protein n=1 Tax=Luteimonas fraxinea TaxID=2901869 RepID=UPI001E36E850|nr:DUF4880 domain-containing protein [Luteimonas fraxinea]MCD9125779.1 DUF4880 domain-containing protein [Luteimonas fraxinea]